MSFSAVSGMHDGAGQASDWHMASPSHTDAVYGVGQVAKARRMTETWKL